MFVQERFAVAKITFTGEGHPNVVDDFRLAFHGNYVFLWIATQILFAAY